MWIEQYGYTDYSPAMSIFGFKDAARAVLARWGTPTIQPEPVAVAPTDEEIGEWHDQCADLTRLGEVDHYWAFDLRSDEVAGVVRAALARWGTPAVAAELEAQ
jgi:hypothetical protein